MKANNKRVVGLILCLLCLAALLAGCDPAAGKRPVDYPNSRWVCEDPHIEIVVDEKGRYTSTLIGDDGEETRFFPWLPFRVWSGCLCKQVVLSDETLLFWGDCKLLKDRFTIQIREDNLWNGAYSKLVFTRVE